MKKRIICFLLISFFVVFLTPISAEAGGESTDWGNLSAAITGGTPGTGQTAIEIDDNTDGVREIKLLKDISAKQGNSTLTVTTTGEVVLDLNGHVINGNGKVGSIITVPNSARLTITDSNTNASHKGTLSEDGYFWTWDGGDGSGATEITGGIITGGYSTDGGGVIVKANGFFKMQGGTICGNKANNCGGGVNVSGMFEMQGGVIEYNIVTTNNQYWGGGGAVIFDEGECVLSAGKIQYNRSANHGGGVLILQSGNSQTPQSVKIIGTSITNNSAENGGGGVYYDDKQVTVLLGGSTKITANVSGGVCNNFHFDERSNALTLAGGENSPNGMLVGVTTYTAPAIDNPVAFTLGGTATDAGFFASDSSSYEVKFVDSKLALAIREQIDPPEPTPEPSPESNESGKTSDMETVNIDGATFTTWEEITANTPALTKEKLQKVNASNDVLLHVNIVGKEDKTVPLAAIQAMDKSSIGGLHVFVGDSDAVTFLNALDYSNYKGKNFAHNDTITGNSRTIDFTDKGAINATVMFHTLISPYTKARIYKVVDGTEILIGTASSNEFGGFCFTVSELATYVIRF